MNNQITVVFPIGGKGERFGGKFKPFLKIFDKTFIQLAVEPFLKHASKIKELVFLLSEEQYTKYNVEKRFKEFHLPIPYKLACVDCSTSIIGAINDWMGYRQAVNHVVFCDSDNSLNVDDLFEAYSEGYDCVIPVWPIDQKNAPVEKWSIAAIDSRTNRVHGIAEKQYPSCKDKGDMVAGVIGCYYFKKFTKHTIDCKYLSDVIRLYLQSDQVVRAVHITEADFFGDPERLHHMYEEKRASTIFCDIDGTIIRHQSVEDYSKDFELLEGAKDKIDQWRRENRFIVLTTARDEQFRPELEAMLRKAGIRYEYLVMGLPSGCRYLINDTKPDSDMKMAQAHEVIRDKGIGELNLGHSAASLIKIENEVYKGIPRDSSAYEVQKLKYQYDAMKALGETHPELVPKVWGRGEHGYSMEYLTGYAGIHKLEDKIGALGVLFSKIAPLYTRDIIAPDWLETYLLEKVFAKAQTMHDLGLDVSDVFDRLRSLDLRPLAPSRLSNWYHGDLTFENILVKGADVKLLDLNNDNTYGAIENDMGKLMQSAYCGYERWDSGDFVYEEGVVDNIIRFYSRVLREPIDSVKKKALFYCMVHLYRMIPYQHKRNPERAHKALRMCRKVLDEL